MKHLFSSRLFFPKKKPLSSGFTLIELLVVLLVIALLSAFTIPNLKSGDKSLQLDRSLHQIARDVRQTTELALQTQKYPGAGCSSISGYGIHFSIQTVEEAGCYLIFAECNGVPGYQGVTCTGTGSADDQIIGEVKRLEKDVTIQFMTPFPTADALFVPPDPTVSLIPNFNTIELTLMLKDGSASRRLVINKKGVVTIE